MRELAQKSIAALPTPPPPDGPAVSPPVIDPERWEDFPCFREIFLVMFTDARANDAMRRFGLLQYEMAIETWGQWPDHREGIFPAELRAAVADMRHVQGAMSSWCGPGFSNTGEYEIRLAEVGKAVALAVGELADRLETELDSWLGKVS